MTLSKVLGLPQDKIRIHVTFLGGGFGRRAEQDFVVQAAVLAKAVGHPVKVIWPREQDMQHDYYRPAFYAKMEGALSASGEPLAWRAVNAGSSIITRWFPDKIPPNGHDFTSIEGFAKLPYAFPNQDIRSGLAPTVAPVGFWRSVGSSQNAFFVESFIDELASAAGRDSYEFRRSLLAKEPRHLAVLEAAAKKARWSGFKNGAGRGMGIALAESFGTIVAEVAEVEVTRVDGADRVRVKRVVCAYDCGPIVNPFVIEAQMESAIIFGMTAALRGEVTLKDGRVEQTSFDSYPLVTLAESPTIEVVRVASEAPMGGIGEPGTPPIAPAIANAIFAATGKRLRRLPLEKSLTSLTT